MKDSPLIEGWQAKPDRVFPLTFYLAGARD